MRNDRSPFAEILADDFCAILLDGRTARKADLMRPTAQGAGVDFSEASLQMFTPTAVTRGRVRIQHADRVVDQRYVRVYSQASNRLAGSLRRRLSGWPGSIANLSR